MGNLVDLPARKLASQLFRNFIAGKVPNNEFEDRQPITDDRAIDAIWHTAWVFYTDRKKHRLEGPYRLPPDQKRACVRWLLFLHGDLPYEWPDMYLPGIDPAARINNNNSFWRRLFSHQDLRKTDAHGFLSAGHYPVWPYIRVSDYKQSLSSPKFLSGESKATGLFA